MALMQQRSQEVDTVISDENRHKLIYSGISVERLGIPPRIRQKIVLRKTDVYHRFYIDFVWV